MQDSISIAAWKQMADEAGEEGGRIALHFYVNGISMTPLVRSRIDRVTILPRRDAVKKGDIVLFKAKTTYADYVIHRVWKVKGNQVLTLGDGNRKPDFWMPVEQIYGVAVELRRGKRSIDLTSAPLRLWGKLWLALYPVRGLLLAAAEQISRMKKR